jgi:hypothetical protein
VRFARVVREVIEREVPDGGRRDDGCAAIVRGRRLDVEGCPLRCRVGGIAIECEVLRPCLDRRVRSEQPRPSLIRDRDAVKLAMNGSQQL